jgi:hypothetical protein
MPARPNIANPEQNGIDILCDAAGSDLLLSSMLPDGGPVASSSSSVQLSRPAHIQLQPHQRPGQILQLDSQTRSHVPLYPQAQDQQPLLPPPQPPPKRKLNQFSPSSSSHVCHICKRVYERADHLTRHLRSHENARPYQCTRCPKRFNRADLLTRHETTHDRDDGPNGGRPFIRRSDRAAEACLNCAASKAKCEDQKPCSRCRTKGVPCVMSTKRTTQYRTSSEGYTSQSLEGSAISTDAIAPSLGSIGDTEFTLLISNKDEGASSEAARTAAIPEPFPIDPMTQAASLMNDASGDMNFFNPVQMGWQDIDFSSWDLNFDTFVIPPLESSEPTPESATTSNSKKSKVVTRDPSRGHAAFKRSPWLWEPSTGDVAMSDNDQDGLALKDEAVASSAALSKLRRSPARCLTMTQTIRDKLFAMVLSVQRGQPRVPTLPSLELLNYLLQAHFAQDEHMCDSWIHGASFNPKDTHTLLLASIIANGATLISDPAIWRFGFSLHEVVRVQIGLLVSDCQPI